MEKWLEQPDIAQYEVYVLDWHCFLEKAEARVAAETDEDTIKNIELYILKLFYMKPYDPQDDFYAQFEARLMAARDVLDLDLAER
ncbi:MAG: hypothetical protein LIO94_08215 [Clostridiales bacterium]|nr:hypothetical protein [Clostridiales bacterium]